MMNAAVDDNQTYVAIGMDSTCRLTAIRAAKLSSKKSTGSPARRRRRTEESRSHADGLTLETVVERQTDFSDQGAFQKCVRFSRSGNALATGGVDSCIRIWTVSTKICLLMSRPLLWPRGLPVLVGVAICNLQ